jgi:hypothetical protein
MTKWIASVVAIGLAAGLPHAATAQGVRVPDASAGKAVFDARHPSRYHGVAFHSPPPDPHYYARPVYYRPYPYGVPAPFVFGYGPFWR